MSINEAFTDVASGTSASTVPTAALSDAVVDGNFTDGQVDLQLRRAGGDWQTIWGTSRAVNTPVATPDGGIEYQFVVHNIVGTVNVYFGP